MLASFNSSVPLPEYCCASIALAIGRFLHAALILSMAALLNTSIPVCVRRSVVHSLGVSRLARSIWSEAKDVLLVVYFSACLSRSLSPFFGIAASTCSNLVADK